MKIVIATQYMENYGSHDWDGKGACPQYWKSKGGFTYIFEGISTAWAMDTNFWEKLESSVTYSDDFSSESTIEVALLGDDDDTDMFHDAWETPIQCTYQDGKVYCIRKTEKSEYNYWRDGIESKIETWVMTEADRLADYVCTYRTDDGNTLDWQGNKVA